MLPEARARLLGKALGMALSPPRQSLWYLDTDSLGVTEALSAHESAACKCLRHLAFIWQEVQVHSSRLRSPTCTIQNEPPPSGALLPRDNRTRMKNPRDTPSYSLQQFLLQEAMLAPPGSPSCNPAPAGASYLCSRCTSCATMVSEIPGQASSAK